MEYREKYDNGLSVDLSGILEPTNVTSILVNYFKHTKGSNIIYISFYLNFQIIVLDPLLSTTYRTAFENLLEDEKCFSIVSDIPSNDQEKYQKLRYFLLFKTYFILILIFDLFFNKKISFHQIASNKQRNIETNDRTFKKSNFLFFLKFSFQFKKKKTTTTTKRS